MLTDHHKKLYESFYEATVNNDLLDLKTTVMIQLAAAFVIGCYP